MINSRIRIPGYDVIEITGELHILKTYLELLESDLKSAIKREREKFDQENKAAFGIITSQVHLAEYHSLIGYFEEKLAMALPQGNCI